MSEYLWSPSRAQIEVTQLYRFMAQVSKDYGLELDSYSALHRWSVTHPELFWNQLWQFCGIIAEHKGERVLSDGERMPGAHWFPDARLNFAENLLRRRDNHVALIFRDETAIRREISFADLYRRVAGVASTLRTLGVSPGDRICGYMPNVPETIIAMLATSAVGAVWSSCSPDFGIQGVMDRFGQVQPKVLFTTDGYRYNGKQIDSLQKIATLAPQIDSLQQIVVVPYLNSQPDIGALDNATLLDQFADPDADEIEFEQLPFNHPLYIMYSSGTTGVPKCIVHSAGGTLLQHLKEHRLHTDLGPEDTLFYYTTCGWMMWNWMASALASEATVLLFDGSPFAPTQSVLWEIAEQEGISVFGTSAKYIAALEKYEVKPAQQYDLSRLRAVLSTGSPLSHESFHYVYRDIKQDLLLASISGGTDIISCFALGCPIKPVYAGEIQCRGLGMAVEIYNEAGQPVIEEKGELVCTRPFPSMPIGFWNDPDGERYHGAYFERFEGIWAHGDYGEITAHDGLIIHGRSDAVLNPGGVRIGTAEIYRQVEKVDEVLESVCIGQPWQDDVRVVLFVRLKPGFVLDDALRDRIKQTVRMNTTPRHVPARIIQVADIPRTLSGKLVEVAVRQMVIGEEVKNRDALANPEALELFRDLPDLQH